MQIYSDTFKSDMILSMNKDQNYELVIVVPIFNRFDEIINLLNQLEKQSYQKFKVLIVDHGTQDLILSSPRDQFPIEIIKASSQLWFTGALNRGLEHIVNSSKKMIKHILIMNDDIVIEDINFLSKLLNESSDQKIVSCMAITNNYEIIYAGIQLEKFKLSYKRLDQGKKIEQLNNSKVICDVLPTRCLLVPINIVHKIGFLNEHRLPHYASDYEWTSRAKKHGFQLVMLNYIYVKTELNDKEVSGKKKYKNLAFFIKDFLNPYKRNNFYQIINYSFLVFNFPYNVLFSSYLITRKITGLLISNFIFQNSISNKNT